MVTCGSHIPHFYFLRRSSQALESLRYRIGDIVPRNLPDVVESLRAVPRLKTLKLEDDAITIDVIHSLTIEPHQPPLLPMLEEMEFNSIEGDPQMVADMTGSRCGLLDTESCHSLRSVRFRLREGTAIKSDWMRCFEACRQQGLQVTVTF